MASNELTTTQAELSAFCEELKQLLLTKNQSYGDSALNPVRIFAKGDALEGLANRLDDKLARVQRVGPDALGEDTLLDLLGYLALYAIERRRRQAKRDAEARVSAAKTFAFEGRRSLDDATVDEWARTRGLAIGTG